MLEHEKPLDGYAVRIGGSAGSGTHGGESIGRPTGMPREQDCDQTVRDETQFINSVQEDDVSLFIPHETTIDLSKHINQNGTIEMGSGVELVSTFCDPDYPGRGGEIVSQTNGHRVLRSRYGEAPTLWGVSFRGPRMDYFDPDHNASDFLDKQSTGLFCYDTEGTLKIVGCEFRGWTFAGLEIGAKEHVTDAEIRRCSFHRNQMEHLGYGAEIYNGDVMFDSCFFDRCRHGIAAFGYPTCSWTLKNSVVGPGPWSGHGLDMHKLANSIDDEEFLKQFKYGGETAGGDILIERCSLMSTWDRAGYGQEAFALRGIPTGKAEIKKSHFWHESKPTAADVQGNAYRQEQDDWKNFYVENNVFGADALEDGDVGAPRAKKAHEDDDSIEEEDPSGAPSKPDNMTQQLSVHGQGDPGKYTIGIIGDVSNQSWTESSDKLRDMGDGIVEISGEIRRGGFDGYELAEGASAEYAMTDTRIVITENGSDITHELLGAGMAQSLADLQAEIDKLHTKLDGAEIVWGDNK